MSAGGATLNLICTHEFSAAPLALFDSSYPSTHSCEPAEARMPNVSPLRRPFRPELWVSFTTRYERRRRDTKLVFARTSSVPHHWRFLIVRIRLPTAPILWLCAMGLRLATGPPLALDGDFADACSREIDHRSQTSGMVTTYWRGQNSLPIPCSGYS